jgi:protein SCO1/2
MPAQDRLNGDTSEERVAALVDEVKQHPEARDRLVELLAERNPVYTGRSANAVVRLRGYTIAAFEQVGLPEAALPYVLEELESGREAYLVAAAARALRGLDRPTAQVVPFLLTAVDNILYTDDAVTFDSFRPTWPASSPTSAIDEIVRTFAWLGEHARSALPRLRTLADDPGAVSATARSTLQELLGRPSSVGGACCGGSPGRSLQTDLGVDIHRPQALDVPTDVPLEDQDGRRLTFGEFFRGRPSVVVFFYTRCDNPSKCSLTITKLGELQRVLRHEHVDERVRTAAITYDPEFDLPARLRAYGENRGVVFGDNDRMFRTVSGLVRLDDYFHLGVSFGDVLVNRHRIELFVLDGEGHIVATFARLQWAVEDVFARVIPQVPTLHESARPATH